MTSVNLISYLLRICLYAIRIMRVICVCMFFTCGLNLLYVHEARDSHNILHIVHVISMSSHCVRPASKYSRIQDTHVSIVRRYTQTRKHTHSRILIL